MSDWGENYADGGTAYCSSRPFSEFSMRRIISLLMIVCIGACRERSFADRLSELQSTETRNGRAGVGTSQSPVDTQLYGVQFQQKGLELADAEMFVGEGKMFFSGDSVSPRDTVRLMLFMRGWHAPEGVARHKFSTVMRRPDGSVAFQSDDFKTVRRFRLDEDVAGTEVYFADMDTTLPYYDCEFTITDVGNGRSLSGSYRVGLK